MTATQQPNTPIVRSVWTHERYPDEIQYIALTSTGKDRRLREKKDTAWGKVLATYLNPKR